MAGAVGEVRVQGLRELQLALRKYSKDATVALKVELATVAENVRTAAEGKAQGEIRNIGSAWWQMRIGSTTRVVYVAPKQRRSRAGSPRPNLGTLLMDRAMQPALEEHEEELIAKTEEMLDRLADWHGF